MFGAKKLQPVIERGTEAVKSATSSLILVLVGVFATLLVAIVTLVQVSRRAA